jgi:hypothetical protein
MVEVIWRSGLLLFVMLGVVPLLGGALLWQIFKLVRIRRHPFTDCWKAYVTACSFGYLALIGLQLIWRGSSDLIVLRAGVFILTTTLIVPLYLRDGSPRTWWVVVIAVPLIDVLILALAIGFLQVV